ncbi:MAG: response regulator [Eubacteriales bacterium]|jgi:CheY-like chemotaxis protein|nr:response regulator [Eubacteriales bacterium]
MMKRVLVVDDNKNNRILESDMLKIAGFIVLEAETAQQGISLAQKERPDILIMDVRLPDMRGTEAAKILRQDDNMSNMPIIFVTASVMKEDKRELVGISNIGFIGKPINTRTFALEINSFLESAQRRIGTEAAKDA